MDAEDDEFGDLYTDVLRPPSAPIPSLFASSKPSSDLNDSDDEDDILLYGKNPNSIVSTDAPRELPKPSSPTLTDEPARVSTAPASDPVPEPQIRAPDAEKATALTEERIGIEVGIDDLDSDQPMIPGLSTDAFVPEVFDGSAAGGGGGAKAKEDGDEEDDWESDDSEDDLQIVLNDTHGPIGAEREEDEDGEDLVIVADGDQHIPGIEEQEWGEEAGQAALDGEKKEGGEVAAKASGGGIAVAGPCGARIGYSGHGFHPHHSQFKVRFLMKMLEFLFLYAFPPSNWEWEVVILRKCDVW